MKNIIDFRLNPATYRALLGGLVILWLIMQFSLFLSGGIRPAGDSGRYLGAAEQILSGQLPLSGKAMSYLAYDSFVALIFGLGLGQAGVIIAQILLSGLAACALYLLGSHLYGSRGGFVAAFLFISFPDLQKWNFYILTESLFISTIILTSYVLLVYQGHKRILLGAVLLAFAAFLRPNGFILLLAFIIYVLIQLWYSGKRHLVGWILLIGALLLAVSTFWIGDMLSRENVLKHYMDGTVIWGHADSALSMQGNSPDCLSEKGNALFEIACFIYAKPAYFLQLAGAKLYYFFLLARPYYSFSHNLLIAGVLLPVYIFTFISCFCYRREFLKWAFPLLIIILQAIMVSLTFADWDSRHIEVVLPLFFLFASGGVVCLYKLLMKQKVKTR